MNKYAELALARAMERMEECASPGVLSGRVRKDVYELFEDDFAKTVRSFEAWMAWTPTVLRLSGYVGSLACLIAESDAGPKASKVVEIQKRHVVMAAAIVKALVCPDLPLLGRLCEKAVPTRQFAKFVKRIRSIVNVA